MHKIDPGTNLLHRNAFNAFPNTTDPDHIVLVRADWSGSIYFVFSWKYDKSDSTQVDLTSNYFVLCTTVKVYNYS